MTDTGHQPPAPAPGNLDAAVDELLDSSEGQRVVPGVAGEAPAESATAEFMDQSAPDAMSVDAAIMADIEDDLREARPEIDREHPEPRPPDEIEQLDEAIAADADKLLLETQRDLPPEPEPVAAAPEPAPSAIPFRSTAPATAVHKHEPEAEPVAFAPTPVRRDEVSEALRGEEPAPQPAVERGPPWSDKLLVPLAAAHDRLGESGRRTVGYCALVTLFFAVCSWSLPCLIKPDIPEPHTPVEEFYDDTTPAHGITAPPRAVAKHEAASGHGESKAKPPAKKQEAKGSAPAKKAAKPADNH